MKKQTFSSPLSRVAVLSLAIFAAVLVAGCKKTIEVTGITLDKQSLSIVVGETANLSATVAPSNATDASVTWKSSDPTVATVNGGTVSAIKVGKATVTASTPDGSHSASCAVTVTAKMISPTSVSIVRTDGKNINGRVYGGEIFQVKAVYEPENANVDTTFYISSDSKDYPVDETGHITAGNAISNTEFQLTVTNSNTKSIIEKVQKIRASKERFFINDKHATTADEIVAGDDRTFEKDYEFDIHYMYRNDSTDVGDDDNTGKVSFVDVPMTAYDWYTGNAAQVITGANRVKAEAASDDLCEFKRNQSDGSLHVRMKRRGRPAFIAALKTQSGEGTPETGTASVFNPVGVDSVVVTPKVRETIVGLGVDLTATVYPSDAFNTRVTWSSSNPNIATVQSDGHVNPVALGEVTITALSDYDGTKLGTCDLWVIKAITGFDLQPKTLEVRVGQTGQLNATVTPSDAPYSRPQWASSDTSIATVDQTGKVTGVSVGTTKVWATVGNVAIGTGISLNSEVTVKNQDVTGIRLNKDSLVLVIGSTERLIATVEPEGYADKTVTWSSSNPTKVFVDNEGAVTALDPGDATITALASDGTHMATCYVFADQPVTKITVFESQGRTNEQNFCFGEKLQFSYKYEPANANTGTDITFHTLWEDMENQPRINQEGFIQWPSLSHRDVGGSGVRRFIVLARSDNGIDGRTTVYSSEPDLYIDNKLVSEPIPVECTAGSTVALQYKYRLDTLSSVVDFRSKALSPNDIDIHSNTQRATFNVSYGDNTVYCTFDNIDDTVSIFVSLLSLRAQYYLTDPTEKSYTREFHVILKPVLAQSVTVTPDQASLTVGDTMTFKAVVKPDNATNKRIAWWVDCAPETAKIDVNTGLLTALGEGSFTVHATIYGGGAEGTSNVTISKPVSVSGVTLDKTSISLMAGGEKGMLSATVLPGNAVDKNVSWSSSNPNIVTVENANLNNAGIVTPVAPGTADIVVSTEDGNYTAICTVTVGIPMPDANFRAFMVDPANGYDKNSDGVISIEEAEAVEVIGKYSNGILNSASLGIHSLAGIEYMKNLSSINVRSNHIGEVDLSGFAKLTHIDFGGNVELVSIDLSKNVNLLMVILDNTGISTLDVSHNAALERLVIANCRLTSLDLSSNPSLSSLNCARNYISTLDASKMLVQDGSSIYCGQQKNGNDVMTPMTLNLVLAQKDMWQAKQDDPLNELVNVVYKDAVSVSRISVVPGSVSIKVGDTYKLQAIVAPSNATDKTLTWSSSDPTVVTVSQDGTITGVKSNFNSGLAYVTATANDGSGVHASCSVEVAPAQVHVTGVSLNYGMDALTLKMGEYVEIVATVEPQNASNTDLKWSVSPEGALTLSQGNDKFHMGATPAKWGFATVTVTTVDGNHTASCSFFVPKLVESITISKDTMQMTVGQTRKLTAVASPDDATNRTITWLSSDKSIATVDQSGNVTAVGSSYSDPTQVKSAVITASSSDGSEVKATCSVYVSPATVHVSGISLDQTSVTMYTDDIGSHVLTATITPANAANQDITWTCDNPNVLWIKESGNTCAFGPAQTAGTAIITATTVDGSKTATCTVNVLQAVSVEKVTLFKDNTTTYADSLQMPMNKSRQLYAVVSPTNATIKQVTWSSSNSAVATVSQSGLVTSVGIGSATITATSNNVVSNSCDVTVPNAATGISLDSHAVTVVPSSSSATYLTATIIPVNAFNCSSISWSCSDADASGASVITLEDTNTANQKMLIVDRALWNSTTGNVITITVSVTDYIFNKTYTDHCVVTVPAQFVNAPKKK
jgi:uncharacterized protein YjdB